MDVLKDVLQKFDSVSLADIQNVELMDRVDSKYVFPFSQLPKILEGMISSYRLLEINNVRVQRYESLYYDTDDFQLYSKHHAGRLNRWKLRFRKYIDSGGLTFFEIKYKTIKGRTIKKRLKMTNILSEFDEKSGNFLKKSTPFIPEIFSPKIWVKYSRMTFVNKYSRERLTIDTHLHFLNTDSTNVLEQKFSHLVIAESKRGNASSISEFIRLVRLDGIREGAMSKYCFGIYNLFKEVKKNNFKPAVRFIHKMAQTDFSKMQSHPN